MDTNVNSQKNISDTERAAFKKALTIYYVGGGPIAKAFAQVEPGLIDRYYRRRKKLPDEMAEIDREARDVAHRERSFEREGFDARQERASWEMRETARNYALQLISELQRIASGEPRNVEIEDPDGTITYKTLIPYPRDQIAAFKALLDGARYGVQPQNARSGIASTVEAKKDEQRGGLLPVFAANTTFGRIEGVAPDGTNSQNG